MTATSAFFVPAATAETQEQVFHEFAKWCGVSAPPVERRIYSIVFGHDGEVWTATVGESLRGERTRTTKARGQKVERTTQVSDPALVLAIFPGSPFMVVTNHNIAGNVGSRWANPFLAGQPKSVTYFAVTQ